MKELDTFSYNHLSSSISKISDKFHEYLSTNFPYTLKATYAINQAILHDFPTSVAKAVYIDFPIYLTYTPSMPKAIYSSSIAGISYDIRSYVKNMIIDEGGNKYIAGIAAGALGGSFRYYILDQNPAIGALNNIAYETCSNIELCNDNPYINIPFTIVVESLDASAQAALKAAKGDITGATLSAAFGGAKIGAFVCANIYMLYIPTLAYITNTESNINTDQPTAEESTISKLPGDACLADSYEG